MKALFTILLACVLVAGCAKPDTRANRELEERVAVLEGAVDLMMGSISNQTVVLERCIEYQKDLDSTLESITDYLARQTNRPARTPPVARVPVQPVQPMKAGVPVAVYNQIVAESQRLFPENYSLQEIRNKGEIEAYLRLHGR